MNTRPYFTTTILALAACLWSASNALQAQTPAAAAAEPTVVQVWPDDGLPPGDKGVGAETVQPNRPNDRPVVRLTNVSKPILQIHRPAKDKDTGAAVVIAPGGAYTILAWDLEGEEVARWLNTLGVTGIILKYRVPRRPGQSPQDMPIQPLQDAQRALRVVRHHAADWGIDPSRIGMLGFSAGGHLTASAATRYDETTYEPIDDIDKLSARPDFVVLVYPAYLVSKTDPNQLINTVKVTKSTPPTFLAHAANDPVTPESSALFFLALKRAGVNAELHIYESGGHGFGLRPSDDACSTWPQRCAEWMKARKLLTKSK